jgi:hypothetical protein
LEGPERRIGQTDAVLLVVADHVGLLRGRGPDEEVDDPGALVGVVRDHAVPVLPAVLRQTRVRRRGRDAGNLRLLQDRTDRPGLTREGGTDESDDLVLLDRLLGEGDRLVGAALAVVLDQLELHRGVRGVVLVDRELRAVARRDHDAGVLAGQVTHEPDLQSLAAATSTRGASPATTCRERERSGEHRGGDDHPLPTHDRILPYCSICLRQPPEIARWLPFAGRLADGKGQPLTASPFRAAPLPDRNVRTRKVTIEQH